MRLYRTDPPSLRLTRFGASEPLHRRNYAFTTYPSLLLCCGIKSFDRLCFLFPLSLRPYGEPAYTSNGLSNVCMDSALADGPQKCPSTDSLFLFPGHGFLQVKYIRVHGNSRENRHIYIEMAQATRRRLRFCSLFSIRGSGLLFLHLRLGHRWWQT